MVLGTLSRTWHILGQPFFIEPYPSPPSALEDSVTLSLGKTEWKAGLWLQSRTQTPKDTLLWTFKPPQWLSKTHTKRWDLKISRKDVFYGLK